MLLIADLATRFTPLLIAALVGWMLCVCVHEFCHALVAYLGGDKSVREKGYLSLDPTKFIDPFATLLLPAVVLLLGGVPLVGGSVLINTASLRSRGWDIAVSAAGPAGNIILFLLLSIPLHPLMGLVDPTLTVQPAWVYFLGAMAFLNLLGALFNLVPVPPLDGFHIIEHFLPAELRMTLHRHSMVAFGILFFILWTVDEAWTFFFAVIRFVVGALGLPMDIIGGGYNYVLFGALPG